MASVGTDDIVYAVERRSRQDAAFRHQLDRAVRTRDEDEIERLIRKAVKKILNVVIDVTFDIIRVILKRF